MFSTDAIVRHYKDLARWYACVALDACDGRLPEFRISLGHNIVFFLAHYKHSGIHKASTDGPLGQDKCQMLIISSGQTQQMNARYKVSPE